MTDTPELPSAEASAPKPTSRAGLSPESLTSALALIISIFALAVSLFEANTQRVQQRASVWPYLEISQRYTADGFALEIVNKGIGPARIQSLDLRFDGALVTDLDAMVLRAVGEENAFSYDLYRTSDLSGRVMSAGEQDQLFAVPWEDRTRLFAAAFNDRGAVDACYCSIFDDCWTISLRGAREPQPVARCER